MEQLVSDVWQMSGFIKSYTAGILTFNNGKLSFLTQKGEQFNVGLHEVKNIKWPRLQFGYGVHFDVNGKTYKITFAQPAGENSLDPGMITDIGRISMGIDAISGILQLKKYKASANLWKDVLK